MKSSFVLTGMTSPEQRKEMLNEAHKLAQDMIDLCKTQNYKPAYLVLACTDLLLSLAPSANESKEFENMILQIAAEAMIKIAQYKGWISLEKLESSDSKDFFINFLKNLYGSENVKVMNLEEEPECTCTYDPRNMARDLNVTCPLHMPIGNKTIH